MFKCQNWRQEGVQPLNNLLACKRKAATKSLLCLTWFDGMWDGQ